MRTTIPPTEVRHAVQDLFAEYGHLIDSNALEPWVELFAAECDYRVISRENLEQNLPAPIIWCDNRDMLRDRVESYRNVNEYNLHWDRHVMGPVRFVAEVDGTWHVEVSYTLVQTATETGVSRLFSAGVYRCHVMVDTDGARFRKVEVVVDTGLIPTLLATPI